MATCTLDRPAARRARLPCLAAPTGGRIVRTPSPKAESSPVDLPAPLSAFSPAFIYLLGIDFKVYLLYIPSRDILGGTEGWTVGNSGAWKSQRRCRFDGTPRVGSFPRRAALAPTGWCLTPTTTYKVAQGIVEPPAGVQPWACNCPDFELRNRPCKHVVAVTYVVRRQSI